MPVAHRYCFKSLDVLLDVSWLANLSVPRREMPQPLRWFSVCWHRDVCICWRSDACFSRHDGDRNLPAGRGRRLWTSSGVPCGVWTPPFVVASRSTLRKKRVEDMYCSFTYGKEDELRGEKWELGKSYSPEFSSGDGFFLWRKRLRMTSSSPKTHMTRLGQVWKASYLHQPARHANLFGNLHLEGR